MAKKLEPITPGQILKEEFLKPLDISQRQFAVSIGVSPGRISEIISGKQGITAPMALRLHKFFGTTPEFWLNLQQHYDLEIARAKKGKEIEKRVIPFRYEEPMATTP
ncbi:MAG: HigA family addiction module antitoxin [Candidatus Hinthialibacter antarcticus]|nr:HigA family addiction module antitoxin [Candidatus Hinthialibacter antarcticus]